MRTTIRMMMCTALLVAVSAAAGCMNEDPAGEALEDEIGSETQDLIVLGGIDLGQQCRRQHGAGATAVLLQPVVSPGAAYAWRCRQGGVDHSIDMHLFCIWQYSHGGAVDAFSDFNHAYSWYCYLP